MKGPYKVQRSNAVNQNFWSKCMPVCKQVPLSQSNIPSRSRCLILIVRVSTQHCIARICVFASKRRGDEIPSFNVLLLPLPCCPAWTSLTSAMLGKVILILIKESSPRVDSQQPPRSHRNSPACTPMQTHCARARPSLRPIASCTPT